MPFIKQGTPQPINVLEDLCSVCKDRKATKNVDGKLVCDLCAANLEKELGKKE